ncbi:MAG: guanylate kinase [Candidatus Hydrogenedentes bacterium]|nr:guanylate kinase [Candidatus Hydrogenedentota bacterium]
MRVGSAEDRNQVPGRRGIVFVVSAPSGAGKRTVLERVFAQDTRLDLSISATTRPPRTGEVHGKDYYFLDREMFERRVEAGDFVEWAEVHGNLYGTLRDELDRLVASGKDTVLELDVQGMRNVKRIGLDAATIFIMAPSMAELERRLRARATDSAEVIDLRLANAREEIAARAEFDYVIVNDRVEEAAADLAAILRAERCRASRQQIENEWD